MSWREVRNLPPAEWLARRKAQQRQAYQRWKQAHPELKREYDRRWAKTPKGREAKVRDARAYRQRKRAT